jgi:hypothetical protein
MNRPPFEVADIIRQDGRRFIENNRSWLSYAQLRVLRAIQHCRSAALGGHVDDCSRCGYRSPISFNSCRNRHCPKCLTQARDRWLAERRKELLDTGYFHVVFTLPHELSWLALNNKQVIYDLLFGAAAKTLLEVAANPQHLGAEIGFLSVLHTWGQNLQHHPRPQYPERGRYARAGLLSVPSSPRRCSPGRSPPQAGRRCGCRYGSCW